jgi:hypothetical protein
MPGVDLRQRIEAWLGEGIDIDADGLYSERSPSCASQVSNPSLLVAGDLLGRPDLIKLVHRNLHAQIDLADPNGVVETVLSRRQDQNADFHVGPFLMQFRRFGVAGCTDCASMARTASTAQGVDAVGAVAELLAAPDFGAELPPSAPIDFPQRRLFAEVRLVRDRRGQAITTVYGGSDVPVTGAPRIGGWPAIPPSSAGGGVASACTRCASPASSSASARSGARASRSAGRAFGCPNTSPLGTISRCPPSVAALTALPTGARGPVRRGAVVL